MPPLIKLSYSAAGSQTKPSVIEEPDYPNEAQLTPVIALLLVPTVIMDHVSSGTRKGYILGPMNFTFIEKF